MTDLVADRWLADWPLEDCVPLMQRARDEIVALRERCAASDVDILLEVGRNEALEEAARKAERYEAPIWSAMIAAAIRALPLEEKNEDLS